MNEFLISPSEAVTLIDDVSIKQFADIYKFGRSILDKIDSLKSNDPTYDYTAFVNALFIAGRVQGIREERMKKQGLSVRQR